MFTEKSKISYLFLEWVKSLPGTNSPTILKDEDFAEGDDDNNEEDSNNNKVEGDHPPGGEAISNKNAINSSKTEL